jgi:hypothetical protein
MSLDATFDVEIEQMDVKNMFLHGDLEEQIYIKHVEGFIVRGKKDLVCELKTCLYCIKQSPRMWYQIFDTCILSLGFLRSKVYNYIYSKEEGGNFIYVAFCIDDMLLIRKNMDEIKEVKEKLSSMFDMKDFGATNFIIGIEIKRD